MASENVKQLAATYFVQHADALRAYLRSKEKNAGLVEDTIQDSFLKLQLELHKGQIIQNPKSWLFKVGSNFLIDHYRYKKSTSKKLANLDINEVDETEEHEHKPEHCLRGIVSNLPYKYKKAIYLVDIKGLKQTEAAKEMKLALPTLKSHVQRGRKLVMKGYMDCCDYKLNEEGVLVGEIKEKKDCKVCR